MGDGTIGDAPRRRRWPWVVAAIVVVLGAVAAVVGVFALQALSVRDDLTEAEAVLGDVVADVRAERDPAVIDERVAHIAELTARARTTVDGPLWSLFAHVPAVGQNVAAVRDVTTATDILVQDALPVGLRLVQAVDVDNLALAGGGIDLAPFVAAQSSLPELDDAFSRAARAVSGIDRTALLPVVDSSIGQVLDILDTAAPSISLLEEYLPTLLQVAGSEGPRRYLVVFQNLAETRATGGNPAATLLLTVDGGRMAFSDQASSATYQATAGEQYIPLPAETVGLYESDTFSYVQNFTRTPDFPTTAALFRTAWQRQTGADIDGVISVDPVVLSMILRVTGPVVLADGSEITADNAVPSVLSDVYARFPGDSAPVDAYFAEVAAAAFSKITQGGWDALAMLDTMAEAAADHRVYVWLSREGEQTVSEELGLAGSLARPAAGGGTELGVFLNDSGYDKLGFYLSSAVTVSCDLAASTTATSVTVTSSVPDAELPYYVTNNRAARYGADRSTMFLDVLFVAPAGGSILSSDPATSDVDGWDRAGVDSGRQAWSRTVVVPRGESRTVTFVSTLPAGATAPLTARTTPGIGDTPVVVDASCGALAAAP